MTVDMGYTDGDVDTNRSDNRSLASIIDERYSRRQTLLGGTSAMTMAALGATALSGCGSDDPSLPDVTTSTGTDTTSAGRPVTLTGSASDDDGIASTAWAQASGPSVTLTQGAGGTATFIAPAVASATDLKFTFTAIDAKGNVGTASKTVTVMPATIGFSAIDKNKLDVVTVPAGYTVQVINRTGDPVDATTPAYNNDGTDSGASFATRFGDHHDALYWFGLNAAGARDDNASARGLLAQNHENINQQYLHVAGATSVGGVRPEDEALKEMYCHGISIVELSEGAGRQWTHKKDSAFNRRITPATVMDFSGPVKGNDLIKTAYSNDGTKGRGTINNCANGHTPWGTLLTCEENWAGYFKRGALPAGDTGRTAKEIASFNRAGVSGSSTVNGNYGWSSVTGNPLLARWDSTVTGASALADYRNEPNQFGWVVEIDPYDAASTPRKRTALGRFGHEGAWPGRFVAGVKPAFYMGDDSQGEYMYKFVSNTAWVAADATAASRLALGDKYLDAGTLYVAKFNADGSGQWLPLVFGTAPLDASNATYAFASQADVLVNPRLAADALGATPMDRPEWTSVNPANGEVYLTLTNNANRFGQGDTVSGRQFKTDAANPRVYVDPPSAARGNRNGHIIRLKETGDTTEALAFTWDIFLFGADSADADATNVNLSGLTAANDFSSPDGLWFGRASNASGGAKPLLWLQTDDGAFTDRTNNQMLVALPGAVNDGAVKTITNSNADASTYTQATRVGASAAAVSLRRFLVGPVACEITGVDSTPDGRTLFVGIQHPGETGSAAAPTSHWPDSQTNASPAATVRPRSATVVITKTDGGVVGL